MAGAGVVSCLLLSADVAFGTGASTPNSAISDMYWKKDQLCILCDKK